MNVGDTARLLHAASQFDSTLAPTSQDALEAKASAWAAALDVRMTLQWALRAVADFYARQPHERLTPAHLNDRLLASIKDEGLPGRGPGRPAIPGSTKAERLMNPKPELPQMGTPVPPTQGYIERRAAALGISVEDFAARQDALRVECPWCKAGVGEPCATNRGRPLTRFVAHPSRIDASTGNTSPDAAGGSQANAQPDRV